MKGRKGNKMNNKKKELITKMYVMPWHKIKGT